MKRRTIKIHYFKVPLGLLILTLFIYGSCDAPTQTRYAGNGKSSGSDVSPFNTSSGQNDYSYDTGNSLTDTPDVSIPLEVNHCSWSRDGVNGFMSLARHLSPNENTPSEGAFTVCQSMENQNVVFIQVKNAIEDAELCLIPTYQIGTSTTYIGEPRCFFARNPLKIYRITMHRNRPGFTHLPVTGVMIMKDKSYAYPHPFNQNVLSPDAFIFCNEQLVHPQYPNAAYCSAFKQAGHYVYKPF